MKKLEKKHKAPEYVVNYGLLLLATGLVLWPLLVILSSAFKDEVEIFANPLSLIPTRIIWENILKLRENFPLYTFNSTKITVIIVLLQLYTATTGGYAFSKLRWRGRDAMFLLYISSIMVPFQVYIIPQFILVRTLGLYDSHLGLILVSAFTAFGTFLIKQFFMSIPDSLLEAARIDGASDFFIFRKIMLPLSKPALATLVIFAFRWHWNDFFVPLIYITTPELKTLPLGMADFVTEYFTYYGPQMAASLIAIIPVMIVFISAQKYFIQGIVTTGIKG